MSDFSYIPDDNRARVHFPPDGTAYTPEELREWHGDYYESVFDQDEEDDAPARTNVVLIEQLGPDGEPFREFTEHASDDELEGKLERIRLAYKMDVTRVTVNGDVSDIGAP